MLIPWHLSVCIFLALGLAAGRLIAGPRSQHAGPTSHYYFGNWFGFPCLLVFGGLWSLATFGIGVGRVYLFDSELRLYYSFGRPQVPLGNGRIETAIGNSLANRSDTTMVLENVTYGDVIPEKHVIILPHSLVQIPTFNIHYFANDVPEKKIKSKSSGASRWWLRRATVDEAAIAAVRFRLKELAVADLGSQSDSRMQVPNVSGEAVEQSWKSFRPRAGLPPTPPAATPKHGFRFGRGTRNLEPTAQEILKMSGPELAEFSKKFETNRPALAAPAQAPFGSDPLLNKLDPYPTEISRREREANARQVERDMNRIIIRDLERERGY